MMRTTRNGVSAGVAAHGRHTDDVAIGLALVDVRLAQRGHAVDQHPLRIGVDETHRHVSSMIVGGGDLVEAVVDEDPIRHAGERFSRPDAVRVEGAHAGDALRHNVSANRT
jgi:hypothetical protein